MTTLFQRALEGFAATAAAVRQASQEIQQELESTRQVLQASGLESRAKRASASASLRRVVTDQVRALNELSELVQRSGAGLGYGTATTIRGLNRILGRAPMPSFRPETPPLRPQPPRPAAPPARYGGSWLSGPAGTCLG